MANEFVFVELQTSDVEKSKDFYTRLFDWQLKDIPGMENTLIRVGDGTGGWIMKNPLPDASSRWLPYVLVDDVYASTEKAKSLGAAISKEVTVIPGFGQLSVITDPTGASLALWQQEKSDQSLKLKWIFG